MKEITFKFYNIKEKLPEVPGDYLTIDKYDLAQTLHFSEKHQRFNYHDWSDLKKHDTPIDVYWWAELSELERLMED